MTLSAALYTLATLGVFLLSAKYGLSKAPLAYHKEIIEQDGTVTPGTQRVIDVLYRVWAGSMAALGICLLGLIWGPAASGAAWAHGVIVLAVAAVAIPSIVVPRRVEVVTQVKTPWRLAVALAGLVVLGCVAWIAGL
ncbi:MAG TPA: hypothetical protein VJ928_06445 [Marivita sp.]|nr:hypothetical protein [Marivita sp.]